MNIGSGCILRKLFESPIMKIFHQHLQRGGAVFHTHRVFLQHQALFFRFATQLCRSMIFYDYSNAKDSHNKKRYKLINLYTFCIMYQSNLIVFKYYFVLLYQKGHMPNVLLCVWKKNGLFVHIMFCQLYLSNVYNYSLHNLAFQPE